MSRPLEKSAGPSGADGMRAALLPVAAIGAVFTLGAFALFPTRTGTSVLVGALIATSNLYVLIRVVEALLTPEEGETETAGEASDERADEADDDDDRDAEPDEDTPGLASPGDDEDPGRESVPPPPKKSRFSGAWAALGMVKMLILFGGIWALMTRELVDPMALVVGYGCLPIGISLRGILPGLRPTKAAGQATVPPAGQAKKRRKSSDQ